MELASAVLCVFGILLLFELREIQAQKPKAKLPIFSSCKSDEECLAKHCCPTVSKKVKICYPNCANLIKVSKITKESKAEAVILGRKYKAFKTPMLTWFQALTKCAKDGGMLADIRTGADHDALSKFSHATFSGLDHSGGPINFPGWMGASSIFNNKPNWLTSTKQKLPAEYFNKNAIKNGACAAFYPRMPQTPIRALWLDTLNCNIHAPYICAYK